MQNQLDATFRAYDIIDFCLRRKCILGVDLTNLIRHFIATPLDNSTIRKAVKYLEHEKTNIYLTYGMISEWDTSRVTSMQRLFRWKEHFNEFLNKWDTQNVTNMIETFDHAMEFNQPLNQWDTSKVTSMASMFYRCLLFNQPLNNWNTSNVTNMQEMFKIADTFNQPLDNWKTSKVNNFNHMFARARYFNQPLTSFDISNAITMMECIFYKADHFKQNLSAWNLSAESERLLYEAWL